MVERELTPQERKRKMEKQRRKRMMQILRMIMALVFCVTLILFAAVNYFKKDIEFSEQENRMLAQMPQLSKETLLDGSFMTDFETYTSDQFLLRDAWIRLKLVQDRFLGKRESNGIYIGKKNYLMEKAAAADEKNLQKNLQAMEDFAQNHLELNMYMALVPNAVHVMKDYLPNHAPAGNQKEQIDYVSSKLASKIMMIDMEQALEPHSSEPIFYKTDHHWTSLGAYYGFDKIAEVMGIVPATEYETMVVANDFSGTLASRSGYTNIKDSVEVYIPKNVTNDYVVYYSDEERKTASLFEPDKLAEKDKYTVFTGGNHPIVEISTTCAEKRVLLMFKDSYANCLLPFMTPYFRKIIVIDPRYYYEGIESLIVNNEVTDVLFLYNVNTFMADSSLGDVLVD